MGRQEENHSKLSSLEWLTMIICTTLDTLDNVNKVLVGNENKSPSSTASGVNYLGEMAIGIFNMLLKGICFHDVLWSKESKISAVKFSIVYYLSLVISWKEKLAFDPSKISAVNFSILYYLSLVISWKEKLIIYYLVFQFCQFLLEFLLFILSLQ